MLESLKLARDDIQESLIWILAGVIMNVVRIADIEIYIRYPRAGDRDTREI